MKLQRPSANKTRAKILKAAKKCFLKHGFAGTQTQLIADTAKVNQTLLFHHFKNKKTLWQEVKASIVVGEMAAYRIDDSSLQHFIDSVVKQRIAVYRGNADLVQLMKWQLLEDDANAISGLNHQYLESWHCSIEKLQEQGELKKELDPQLVIVMLSTWVNGAFMQSIYTLSDEQISQYEQLLILALMSSLSP